jgi:hypothetical protein
LAGVLLSAFGSLATFRIRVAETPLLSESRRLRAYFRESAAQLLTASLVAGVDAVVLGIGTTIRRNSDDRLDRISSALVVGLSVLLLLLFLATLRRMYATYVETFEGGKYLQKPQAGVDNSLVSNGSARDTHTELD